MDKTTLRQGFLVVKIDEMTILGDECMMVVKISLQGKHLNIGEAYINAVKWRICRGLKIAVKKSATSGKLAARGIRKPKNYVISFEAQCII